MDLRRVEDGLIVVDLDATGMEERYLACLNISFGTWGGADHYRWAFLRTAGGPPSDLMVLREGEEWLAGSAVSYRRARVTSDEELLVGIMTGSWTLPAARGRGCFTRVIRESLALCRERGASLLLAFVMENNASCRRLSAAGAMMFPTQYWRLEPGRSQSTIDAEEALTVMTADAPALWQSHESRSGIGLRITYPDVDSYRGQFLIRPASTVAVVGGPLGRAIVERVSDTDRVLAMYPERGATPHLAHALRARAGRAGRNLFAFTASGNDAGTWADCGFPPKPGFVAALSTDAALGGERWMENGVCLENGDRM